MADKPLKSITFPGLSDRYVIDDGTFIITATGTSINNITINKTYQEILNAVLNGKTCIIIETIRSGAITLVNWLFFIQYKSSDTRGIIFAGNGPIKNLNSTLPMTSQTSIAYYIKSDGTFERSVGTMGVSDAYDAASSRGMSGVAVAQALSTLDIPTIDTSIDSSSVDTEVASAKAVYDYVQSAIGDAIGGAY